ncbi:ImmA/IrrE family metallo-endopeptidase [Streptomyces sp. NBC_00199]|uniref:ImmA/IrrE family metallo-endopeptidase n=1 Tax=Streptomyces sp. NBC_00199 TaxID=2975678 RepID=UPI0022526389|nr:ImmA/IrrE family metallo-endopeptidase [Streptomyces sp. NBC_00199]MCX5269738.1 ImmA/IrrE family metallo-endopeptidase [Streptomyces sp. NBC_00199]
MAVTWERFSGSTDTFAIRLSFMPDPDHGAGAEPDESSSWGAMQVWVAGQNLCAHVDQGEVLQSSHWYLLPFLEWLADNWNPLLHEERLPNRNVEATAVASLDLTRNAPSLASESQIVSWEEERYDWRSRHAIRSGRAGGLFPNVIIRRLRDAVEISWDDEPLAGTQSDFAYSFSGGAAILPPSQVANPLFEVATEAINHLYVQHPESARIQKIRSVLGTLSAPTQDEDRLGWLAGLRSPSFRSGAIEEAGGRIRNSWEHIRRAIGDSTAAARAALVVEERTPLVVSGSCQAALLFGSVSPTVSEADVQRLAALLVQRYDAAGDAHARLEEYAEECLVSLHTPAWEQGYDLAESLHDEIQPDEFVDVDEFVDSLGIQRTSIQLEDVNIRACSLVGPQHVPTIALNSSYARGNSPHVNRFSVAHELCHLLYDRNRGRRLALASGPWAPVNIERRANAFAAMFLMPPHLVEEAISASPAPINTPEGISFVAGRLRVGFQAAVEHLYNLTFMTEEEKESLLGRMYGTSR